MIDRFSFFVCLDFSRSCLRGVKGVVKMYDLHFFFLKNRYVLNWGGRGFPFTIASDILLSSISFEHGYYTRVVIFKLVNFKTLTTDSFFFEMQGHYRCDLNATFVIPKPCWTCKIFNHSAHLSWRQIWAGPTISQHCWKGPYRPYFLRRMILSLSLSVSHFPGIMPLVSLLSLNKMKHKELSTTSRSWSLRPLFLKILFEE